MCFLNVKKQFLCLLLISLNIVVNAQNSEFIFSVEAEGGEVIELNPQLIDGRYRVTGHQLTLDARIRKNENNHNGDDAIQTLPSGMSCTYGTDIVGQDTFRTGVCTFNYTNAGGWDMRYIGTGNDSFWDDRILINFVFVTSFSPFEEITGNANFSMIPQTSTTPQTFLVYDDEITLKTDIINFNINDNQSNGFGVDVTPSSNSLNYAPNLTYDDNVKTTNGTFTFSKSDFNDYANSDSLLVNFATKTNFFFPGNDTTTSVLIKFIPPPPPEFLPFERVGGSNNFQITNDNGVQKFTVVGDEIRIKAEVQNIGNNGDDDIQTSPPFGSDANCQTTEIDNMETLTCTFTRAYVENELFPQFGGTMLYDLRDNNDNPLASSSIIIEFIDPNIAAIPTLSEWGIFLFALLILMLGLVTIFNIQLATATAQSSSVAVNHQFHFPFDLVIFKKMMRHAIGLGIVGLVIILIGWGEITGLDLMMLLLSVPLIGYILQLIMSFKK